MPKKIEDIKHGALRVHDAKVLSVLDENREVKQPDSHKLGDVEEAKTSVECARNTLEGMGSTVQEVAQNDPMSAQCLSILEQIHSLDQQITNIQQRLNTPIHDKVDVIPRRLFMSQLQQLQEKRKKLHNEAVKLGCVQFTPTKAQIDEYARSHGFPDSDYPYHGRVNRCGSSGFSENAPDGWYPVSFESACNNHDRCYMTYGTTQSECDDHFFEDLKAAVKRDLSQKTKDAPLGKVIVGGFKGTYQPTAKDLGIYQLSQVAALAPPIPLPLGFVLPKGAESIEPGSLARGLAVAEIYYIAVKAIGKDIHTKAQEQAKKYKDLVEAYIHQCEVGSLM